MFGVIVISLTEGEVVGPGGRQDHESCLSRAEFEVLMVHHLEKLKQ